MSNKNPSLSIIVPIYNEEKFLKTFLPKIFQLKLSQNVIIINDGSTDSSATQLKKLAENYQFRLLSLNSNSGKGSAIRLALKYISSDYFIVCDADAEYDPNDIIKLWQKALKSPNSKQVIYGSRWLGNYRWNWHFMVNKFLTTLTNQLFKSSLTDMETCFKLIPTVALKDVILKSSGFEIEPELTAQLIKNGYPIKEVPIRYTRRGWRDGKKIGPRDGWLAIKTLIKQKLKH